MMPRFKTIFFKSLKQCKNIIFLRIAALSSAMMAGRFYNQTCMMECRKKYTT